MRNNPTPTNPLKHLTIGGRCSCDAVESSHDLVCGESGRRLRPTADVEFSEDPERRPSMGREGVPPRRGAPRWS